MIAVRLLPEEKPWSPYPHGRTDETEIEAIIARIGAHENRFTGEFGGVGTVAEHAELRAPAGGTSPTHR